MLADAQKEKETAMKVREVYNDIKILNYEKYINPENPAERRITTFRVAYAANMEFPFIIEIGNGWGCYDLGLQNENLVLKAWELGYGTVIMGLRTGDKLREILSIPETETVMAVIAIGKAAEEPARPKRKDVEDIVRFY